MITPGTLPPPITDLTGLLSQVTLILLDDPRLNVPIVSEWKLQMESDQQVSILWQLPRSAITVLPNGILSVSGATGGNYSAPNPATPSSRVGAGIMIEMPEMDVNSPDVTGSPATWKLSVVCFEERNTNFTPGVGTGVSSEQYAQIVLDDLQLQWTYLYGTIKVKQNAIQPAHDLMSQPVFDGIWAMRVSFEATTGRLQSTRSAGVTSFVNNGFCTLSCSDPGAAIFFTVDYSAPTSSNCNSNPLAAPGVGSTLYTAPFAVTSGQTILYASRNFTTNTTLSPVGGTLVP